jgi:hypothetical protein
MANIKDPRAIAQKWARVTPTRTEDYVTGIQNPRVPWAAATAAAEDRYKAGVTEAAAQGRFGKGVKNAGDATWQQNAIAKGPGRFAEGVAVGEASYQEGFAPYADVIRAVTLPPRAPRGSPQNLQRVAAITTALRKRKTG